MLGLALSIGAVTVWELESATLQSSFISRYAADIQHWVEEGPNPALRFPGLGPYDERLGYSRLPDMLTRLEARGFEIVAQARVSPRFEEALDVGLFPIYDSKSQAGLRIVDRRGDALFERAYPERALDVIESVPPVVANSLLFIENRGLLDATHRFQNPAMDWRRMGTAITRFGMRAIGDDVSVPGASTLATQIEKFRHSAHGVTPTPAEKLRQMATASVKAYRDGRETFDARQRIVVEYLNGVPYSAVANRGEVHGLLDALWFWYGIEPDELALLHGPVTTNNAGPVGRAYRAALSLIIAGRGPSFYLATTEGRIALHSLTDAYLRLLEADGIITSRLAAAARDAALEFRPHAPAVRSSSYSEQKAANAMRTELLQLLGARSLYSLDRYDLTVRTSIDEPAQQSVTVELTNLRDPDYSAASGMTGFRLLPSGGSAATTYSFLLYEATPTGNLLRVQTDSHEGPLDINRQTRLELGSTAKLRALISYLEAVAAAHGVLAGGTTDEQAAYRAAYTDPLTRWVAELLANDAGMTLESVLAAAMQRRYSANPAERFFTGGGLHQFSNFDSNSDHRSMTVDEAFQQSVNLVFIRMMRDVVRYHIQRLPDGAAVVEDRQHPARQRHLERFADHEGQVFLTRFHRRHYGKTLEESIDLLAGGTRNTGRLARIYRALSPSASVEELTAFLSNRGTDALPTADELERLYHRSAPQDHHLADLGHLAGVHPLELWVAAYLVHNPEASLAHVLRVGSAARQDAYRWLFRTTRRAAQDERIRIVLEGDAFAAIHRDWQRLGYPFMSLVPSYATAIGSSGDNPQALAELVGILVNDGVRQPSVTIEELQFAAGTPFETHLRALPKRGERVLSAEVARATRDALAGVVEHGTGRRVHQVFLAADGTPLPTGGKTGTGDNRIRAIGAGGQTISARPLNRTATFVFYVGNYFGVVTAYVEGEESGRYSFTSALPAQILRHLTPALEPLLRSEAAAPAPDPALRLTQLTRFDAMAGPLKITR
jgi:membrane peptidoglycan carboxypeptidase